MSPEINDLTPEEFNKHLKPALEEIQKERESKSPGGGGCFGIIAFFIIIIIAGIYAKCSGNSDSNSKKSTSKPPVESISYPTQNQNSNSTNSKTPNTSHEFNNTTSPSKAISDTKTQQVPETNSLDLSDSQIPDVDVSADDVEDAYNSEDNEEASDTTTLSRKERRKLKREARKAKKLSKKAK